MPVAKKPQRIVDFRGHIWMKSSALPACPICWPGFYKKGEGAKLARTDKTKAALKRADRLNPKSKRGAKGAKRAKKTATRKKSLTK